jgi:peroxiredoxin Q/BCP
MTRQLEPGDRAPDFTLQDQHDQRFTLSQALSQGPVVLFFYPKDDTPVCTKEACGFRDQHQVFADHGAQVVGVSRDSVERHKNFAARHELPFKLLSDPEGAVRALFGVKKTLGFFDGRVTFVIDRDGSIRHAFRHATNAAKHVEAALTTLKRIAAT